MCDHPNVLSCYASFVHENELWLVMEFMSKGSCLHVMNVAKKEVIKHGVFCFSRAPGFKGLTHQGRTDMRIHLTRSGELDFTTAMVEAKCGSTESLVLLHASSEW